MTDDTPQQRPIVVQIVCGLGFLTALPLLSLLLPAVRAQLIQQYGENGILAFALSCLGSFVAAIGCWQMRKWGVYLFAALAAVSFVTNLMTSGLQAAVVGSLIQFLIVTLLFAHLDKMS